MALDYGEEVVAHDGVEEMERVDVVGVDERVALSPPAIPPVSSATAVLSTRILASAMSGVVEVGMTHPIDVVKTRLQQQGGSGNGALGAVMRELRAKGGWYAGVRSRVLGVAPMRIAFWTTQSTLLDALGGGKGRTVGLKELLLAGAGAGVVQTLIDTPIEVYKTRSIGAVGLGAGGAAEVGMLRRVGGVRGMFRGFGANLVRNVVFASIVCSGVNMSVNPMLGGAIGGLIGSFLTQPIDYIKTIQQSAHPTTSTTPTTTTTPQTSTSALLRNTPFRTLMSGALPRATLSMSTMAIGATVYNLIQSRT